MAKLPKLGRIPRDKKKIAKMRRNKNLRRDVGRRFLKNLTGLDANTDFAEGSIVTKKLGLFGKEANKKAVDKGMDVPPLESAKKIPNEAQPTISSLVKQLSSLLKTANKIGLLTKQQQEALVNQIVQAKRVAKEQEMEKNVTPTPEAPEGAGPDIGPLNDVITELAKQLEKLTHAVKEKVDEQNSGDDSGSPTFMERFADNLGFDLKEAKQFRADKARKAYREGITGEQLLDKNGKKLHGAAKKSRIGRIMKDYDAAKAIKKPGIVSRGLGKTTSAISNVIGGAARKAAAKGGVKAIGKAAIKKLAMPTIVKALGKTALKSIPIVGAVAGLGFAAQKLLEGDPVGAGLEAASGLGGPMTAIPAMVASIARDVYTGAYGVPPEQDPEMGTRFEEVKSAVGEAVTDQLKGKMEKKEGPTGQQAQQAAPPPPPPAQAQQTASPNISSTGASPSGGSGGDTPPSATMDDSAGSGGTPSSAPSTPAAAAPAPAGGSSPSAPGTSPEQKPVTDQAPITMPSTETAKLEPPTTATGAAISSASTTNSDMAAGGGNPNVTFPGTSVPTPATKLTSRAGARGMGNVPDPNYSGMGTIPAQIYFKAVA